MQTPPAVSSITVDDALPCHRCGYDLRGLAENGRCPECGSPVTLSRHGGQLRFSDPDWLRIVRAGCHVIVLADFVHILAAIAEIFRMAGPLSPMLVLADAITVCGIWMVTRPDPSGRGEEAYGGARRLTRWFVSTAAGTAMVITLTNFTFALPTPLHVTLNALYVVAGVVAVAGVRLSYAFFRGFTLRIPSIAMSMRARRIGNALVIVQSILVFFSAGLFISATRGVGISAGGPMIVFTCTGLAALIVLLILTVAEMGFLMTLAGSLTRQLAAAPPPTPPSADGA